MTTKQLTQQNFQGEVTSGFIMRLEKQTQENIRLGRQPINNKGEKMLKKDIKVMVKWMYSKDNPNRERKEKKKGMLDYVLKFNTKNKYKKIYD